MFSIKYFNPIPFLTDKCMQMSDQRTRLIKFTFCSDSLCVLLPSCFFTHAFSRVLLRTCFNTHASSRMLHGTCFFTCVLYVCIICRDKQTNRQNDMWNNRGYFPELENILTQLQFYLKMCHTKKPPMYGIISGVP